VSNPTANRVSEALSDGERTVSFAGFVFEPARQELRKADAVIPLSPKSLALLRYFLAHEGRVLGKDELIQALWGAVVVTDDSLVQCVKDLRTALGDKDQQIIKTLPRRGYMFDAPGDDRPATARRRRSTQCTPCGAPAMVGMGGRQRPGACHARYVRDRLVPARGIIDEH
jgi:DNA-binding winged helix-turn-helix (wHTH) protein